LYSVELTAEGGYILGGISVSNISGDKTENSLGNYDFWIVKTDSTGNIHWDNTLGGNGDDQLYSMYQTIDNGFILGGYSISNISSDKTENSLGEEDYWVVKTDASGNIEWQNTIGGNDLDKLQSIGLTLDGGYILCGSSSSNISSDKAENCLGFYDYWIVKLTNKYNLMSGHIYADINSNGVHEIGEPPLLGRKITEQTSGRFTFTDQNGNYILSVLDTGNFTVSPHSLNWFSPSPSVQSATFFTIHQTDSLNDFAFQPQGTFEDVCITITPLGNFRSGFTASYMISYGNYGTTTVTPTVYFLPIQQYHLSVSDS
jgi:hypothetical protein